MAWALAAGEASTAVLDEPMLLEPAGERLNPRNVVIHDLSANRIVTSIEVLSPWNKTPGRAVDEYLAKRAQYISSRTNLVEIDLIRAGNWTEMIGAFLIRSAG